MSDLKDDEIEVRKYECEFEKIVKSIQEGGEIIPEKVTDADDEYLKELDRRFQSLPEPYRNMNIFGYMLSTGCSLDECLEIFEYK